MERFTNRWFRRLGTAVAATIVFGCLLIGAPTLLEISADVVAASTELVAAPPTPDLPPAQAPEMAAALKLPPPEEPALEAPAGVSGLQAPR
jgi:hypothetical protein